MHSTQTQALISWLCSAIRPRHEAWPMETEGRTFKSFPKERWQKWTNSSSNGRFIWRNCVISPWKSSNWDVQFEWNKRVIGNVSGWIPSKHRWCGVLTSHSYVYLVTLLEYSTSEWVEVDADCSPWLVQTFWYSEHVFIVQEISRVHGTLSPCIGLYMCKSENWGAKETTGFLEDLGWVQILDGTPNN